MSGSIIKVRKGMRPKPQSKTKPMGRQSGDKKGPSY